jgi:hypothetical protein
MSRDLRPDRPRVFGIGLNKTGTSSFHHAMTMLGLESLHWGGPEVRDKVQAALDTDRPLLTNLDPRFDAFSDILLLSTNFARLDAEYPGSKFVLTVRDVDAWVDSRRRHVENNIARKARGEYDGTFLVVDEAGWRAEWDAHVVRVRDYFAGRDDFLEIDITAGPGWEPFCELLGIEAPDAPFPWENRDDTVTSDHR